MTYLPERDSAHHGERTRGITRPVLALEKQEKPAAARALLGTV
jgi:hypothetical protein